MPKIPTKKPAQNRLEWVGSHFDSFQLNGQGYKALCPLHDDSKPSLSIREGADGKILIHCHAGCPTCRVLEVVGLGMRDLMPDARWVSAEYDYRDEHGKLRFQVVRYEPKEFRQRRPKPGGGWDWSTKDVRKVPYLLPELIKADKSELVFVPAGEKDVNNLVANQLVATTNVGGEGNGKWLTEYNKFFEGRHVVILPDNDPTGWDHSRNVARHLQSVAASVKIVELPDLPEKGDVSDWLNNGGSRAKLLKLVSTTQPITQHPSGDEPERQPDGENPTGDENAHESQRETCWVNPVGESDEVDPMGVGLMGKVLPFPVDALPGVLGEYVESIAAALPCPVDFPGTMILPVLATFIGLKRQIQIKPSWNEYALLWAATVARSGGRKTPAFLAVTEPLRSRQQVFLAEYIKSKEEYQAIPLADRKSEDKPRLKQILTTDTTIEALKDVLAINSTGIIYPADELGGWARSIGQYKGGRGDDRQIWLSIWSSTQIVTNRKSSPEPIVINRPFVCVTGGIQPDALPDVIDDSREDGFSVRILFSYPDETINAKWTEATVKRSRDYGSICEQLFDLKPTAKPITFSEKAKARFVEWVEQHRSENPPDNLCPTWSKSEGHCLRLTLVLHLVRQLCNETRSMQIDGPSIESGIKLVDYFKSHAHRVYAHLAVATGKDKIPNALRWIRKHGGKVTARVARMNGFTKDADEASQLFHDLQELGHGTVTKGKQGNVTFTLKTNRTES